jgi:hypothetical protein
MVLALPDLIRICKSQVGIRLRIRLLYDFLSLKNDVNVPVFRIDLDQHLDPLFLGLPDPHADTLVRGTVRTRGSAYGSVPKCHGSATTVKWTWVHPCLRNNGLSDNERLHLV